MHPCQWAESHPDKPAIIMAESGSVTTYGMLEQDSNKGAHLFRSLGLKAGDRIAIWCDNRPEYLTVSWAAERAGLLFAPVSTKLTAAEAAYIIDDCDARAVIAAPSIGGEVQQFMEIRSQQTNPVPVFSVGAELTDATPWQQAIVAMPGTPIPDQSPGGPMLYSSGTTGRPKGIIHAARSGDITAEHRYEAWHREMYGMGDQCVFMSPAPLYHAAPLQFCMAQHRMGGTVLLLDRFDAETCLELIQRYRVTHTQMVPTMFIRLLRLPDDVKARYDISSLKIIVHAGAPCPVPVKQALIDWLGPIVHEYYSGSEGFGRTVISSQEWLAHPGSVGRAIHGVIHICDEDGEELPAGEKGTIYFDSDIYYEYHKDPAKTQGARNPRHPEWRTYGDIGFVDVENYLYLTDRKAFMIISGGVNIYPQEAENLLSSHPEIADAAVFGVPDPEMGEQVMAVVQPVDWNRAGDDFAAEIIDWCRQRLAHFKCPRRIAFERELPRHATGKLQKTPLRDRYRDIVEAEIAQRIVSA